MNETKYKILSIIVCEDIRTELGGKQTINGIYDDMILSEKFPMVMAQLFIRIAFRMSKRPPPKKMLIKIFSPSQVIFEYDGPFPELQIPATSALIFAIPLKISPLMVGAPSTFQIKFGLDGPMRKIGEFEVREAKTDAEKARLIK